MTGCPILMKLEDMIKQHVGIIMIDLHFSYGVWLWIIVVVKFFTMVERQRTYVEHQLPNIRTLTKFHGLDMNSYMLINMKNEGVCQKVNYWYTYMD